MRGLEVAQPAVLDVGDVAAGELELEQARVVRRAHEHRLLAQRGAALARVEHALADLGRLGGLVEAEHELGRAAAGALGAQGLAVGALGLRRHGVGDVEQRLGRAVVALEGDHRRAGEVLGEGEDVLGRGRAKAVDGLQVVADDGDVGALAAQAADEVDLEPVDVLVLVDEQVVDRAARAAPRRPRPGPARASRAAGRRGRSPRARACARRSRRTGARGRRRGARTTGRPRPAARAAGAGR